MHGLTKEQMDAAWAEAERHTTGSGFSMGPDEDMIVRYTEEYGEQAAMAMFGIALRWEVRETDD